MRHKARGSGGKYALLMLLCRQICLLFGKRLKTNLPWHQLRKYPSTRYRICLGLNFFQFGKRILKCPDLLSNSPYACGWKPYSKRKSHGLKNIRIHVDKALVPGKTMRSSLFHSIPVWNLNTKPYTYNVLPTSPGYCGYFNAKPLPSTFLATWQFPFAKKDQWDCAHVSASS